MSADRVKRVLFPHYEVEYCEHLQIHIVHWPNDIPMVAPTNLDTNQVYKLYSLWKSGRCRWERMPLDLWKALKADLKERREAGEKVDPPRRSVRSDMDSSH
jgi:hypothetical protein